MGLDLWLQEDVARILASVHETAQALSAAVSPQDSEVADAYQAGFVDALLAVAVASDVQPGDIVPSQRQPPGSLRIVDAGGADFEMLLLDLT